MTVLRAVSPPCSLPVNGTGYEERTRGPIVSQATGSQMQGHIFRERLLLVLGNVPQLLSPAPLGPPTPPLSHFLSPKPFALSGLPGDLSPSLPSIPASPQIAHHKALNCWASYRVEGWGSLHGL